MNDLEQTIVMFYSINCDIKNIRETRMANQAAQTTLGTRHRIRQAKHGKLKRGATQTSPKNRGVREGQAMRGFTPNLKHLYFSGNEQIHKMTEPFPYILRVELEDFENRTRYAEYQSFTVGNAESKYRLDIDGYLGNAGLFTNTML
jgi:hypothetical protein